MCIFIQHLSVAIIILYFLSGSRRKKAAPDINNASAFPTLADSKSTAGRKKAQWVWVDAELSIALSLIFYIFFS